MNSTIKTLIILVILQVCFSCNTDNQKDFQVEIIDIEAGFKNLHQMNLSDIADSIVNVKLETRPECLIGKGAWRVHWNLSIYGESFR